MPRQGSTLQSGRLKYGDFVFISDDSDADTLLKDYGGWWTISNVASNTFVIGATFTSDLATATTRVRHYQNSSIIQYNGNLPLGGISDISKQDGDFLELKIQYYINRQNTPVQDEGKYAHLQVIFALENQDAGSDLYATNIGQLDVTRTNIKDFALRKEFDCFFTDEERSIVYPTNQVETGKLEELTITMGLNIDSSDTYKPYLAIAQGYGNDYDLGSNGLRLRSVQLTMKTEYSGPGLIEESTGYTNQSEENNVTIPVGAITPDVNLEYKAKRIFLNSSGAALANTSSSWESTYLTDTFQNVVARPYKLAYQANQIRLRIQAEANNQDISIRSVIQDKSTFGRKFMTTEIMHNCRDDVFSLALNEITPKPDITEYLGLTNTADFIYFPGHFDGPPQSIYAIQNLVSRELSEGALIESADERLSLNIDVNGIPYLQISGDDSQYETSTSITLT